MRDFIFKATEILVCYSTIFIACIISTSCGASQQVQSVESKPPFLSKQSENSVEAAEDSDGEEMFVRVSFSDDEANEGSYSSLNLRPVSPRASPRASPRTSPSMITVPQKESVRHGSEDSSVSVSTQSPVSLDTRRITPATMIEVQAEDSPLLAASLPVNTQENILLVFRIIPNNSDCLYCR